MEKSGKDIFSPSQSIPEIRIRKGSDVASGSESDPEQEGYAPLAFDEGLSDLDDIDNASDQGRAREIGFSEDAATGYATHASGFISPTLQLDLSCSDETSECHDGSSEKDDRRCAEKSRGGPRPPRPTTNPTKPAPPRPPQIKSPAKQPPARPTNSPLATTHPGGDVGDAFSTTDDLMGTATGDIVDYLADDMDGGGYAPLDPDTKPVGRPHSTTPINFTDYTDSTPQSNSDQDKIKIILPKSSKSKSKKQQGSSTTEGDQNEGEAVLSPPPSKRHAPAPPPPPCKVKTRPARPPLPPPPSKADRDTAAAEPKRNWELFDDTPSSLDESVMVDEAAEAGHTSNDDDGDDEPFSGKPTDGGRYWMRSLIIYPQLLDYLACMHTHVRIHTLACTHSSASLAAMGQHQIFIIIIIGQP